VDEADVLDQRVSSREMGADQLASQATEAIIGIVDPEPLRVGARGETDFGVMKEWPGTG
jgi:hypothetical protein